MSTLPRSRDVAFQYVDVERVTIGTRTVTRREPHVRGEAAVKAKKVIPIVVAAVLVYTLVAHPTQLGDGVQTIFGWIGDGLGAIVDFMRSVTS